MLKNLYINLSQEEQVDYILKKMPNLAYLNGLPVDRDDLYGGEGMIESIANDVTFKNSHLQESIDESNVDVKGQEKLELGG